MNRFGFLAVFFCVFLSLSVGAQEAKAGVAERLDAALEPVAYFVDKVVFTSIPVGGGEKAPIVLILLTFTAAFLTIYFRFINVRSFRLAWRTIRGRYSSPDDPGQITHFQALTTALSATVGLGNIAGVAVAIGLGGPGAVFWMVLMGFLGMTSKFTECTLGVRYRRFGKHGNAHGGGMYYLQDGLKERGVPRLGKFLAIWFAVACIGGALGAGNMFQINQAYEQVSTTFGLFTGGQAWIFGLIVALMVGSVIIGGIVWIARVTEFLVPIMCGVYVLACLAVLVVNFAGIPAAFATIIKSAFTGAAVGGGTVGAIIVALIQGIKRGVFSNEAGVGSAAIAHAAVKTRKPASEGIVALLEPFTDTVIVCTMTALVIVVTGTWKVDGFSNDASLFPNQSISAAEGQLVAGEAKLKILKTQKESLDESEWVQVRVIKTKEEGFMKAGDVTKAGGIWLTSKSFETVISWFPKVLSIAVFLFAFSTMISWSYYGEQALDFLTGNNRVVILCYKAFFCFCVVVGAAASLGNVVKFSDALFFMMVVPNLIGLFVLLPVVKQELKSFRGHVRKVDEGG